MVREGPVQKSKVIVSTTRAVEVLTHELLKDVQEHGFDEDAVFGIHLAMEEAFLNAVEHGNRGDKTKRVRIECRIDSEKFEISIADEGAGFDPEALPDPRSEENLCRSNGRGVLLMRAYMDVVEYNQAGNCVHMAKYKSRARPGGRKDHTP